MAGSGSWRLKGDGNSEVTIAAPPGQGKGEFRNRLLLVTLQGKITPLTGYQRSDRAGSWTPVFTRR
jgi:hypothetical protein